MIKDIPRTGTRYFLSAIVSRDERADCFQRCSWVKPGTVGPGSMCVQQLAGRVGSGQEVSRNLMRRVGSGQQVSPQIASLFFAGTDG